jgi:hypothetical protein
MYGVASVSVLDVLDDDFPILIIRSSLSTRLSIFLINWLRFRSPQKWKGAKEARKKFPMHRRPRGPYNASFNSSQSIPVSNQQHEIARQTKLLIDDQSYIHLDKPQPLASGCFTGLDDQVTVKTNLYRPPPCSNY